MQIHHDINSLPQFNKAVITIGSFDGVHKGHQKILERLNQLAHQIDGESILITFDPHPREVIFPNADDLNLLSDVEEKVALFKKYGLDHVVIVPFTVAFSQLNPREYIEKFLVANFNPAYIVIGYDHRFGLNRSGNINMLLDAREKYNFEVEEIKKQDLQDIAISSTQIRNALSSGDISKANVFLNHFYTLRAKVVHGNKIGGSIGFPTANLKVFNKKKLIPQEGIYAVVIRVDEEAYKGMLYIGKKPTISDAEELTIEVNIFDFDANIYDQTVGLDFVEYIRGDQKFDSLEDLKQQLILDRIKAKEVLAGVQYLEEKRSQTTVSILNFNGVELLERFLPSVLYSSSKPINVQVIDNGSDDDSVRFLEEWYPEIDLFKLDRNLGFAGAYNKGVSTLKTKYVVLLNSDVEVSKKWLDPIIKLMDEDLSVGCCQPVIRSLEEKKKFEYAGAAGGMIDKLGYPFCLGRIMDTVEEDKGQYNDKRYREVFWCSGAAMVIRTSLFLELGGLDTDFFAHQEEIDLCWRVKKAGHKCMVVNDSVVYHLGGGTLNYGSERKVFLNFRNNLTMLAKNEASSKLIWLIPLRLVLDGIAGIKFLLSGHWRSCLAIIKAHFAFYRWIPSISRKRRMIAEYLEGEGLKDNSQAGRYKGSILWAYYLRGKKHFTDLS